MPAQKPQTKLWLEFSKQKQNPVPRDHSFNLPSGKRVVLGFYSRWDTGSCNSLAFHASELTHVASRWMTVVDGLGTIVSEPDADLKTFARNNGLTLMPVLDNLKGDTRMPEAIEGLANGPETRHRQFAADLIQHLKAAEAGGVVIDLGQIDPFYKDALTLLLTRISEALHLQGMELWLCIPMGLELKAFDLEMLAPKVDRFIALLHDENSEEDPPGPIASQNWVEGWLETMIEYGNPSQWIAGLGSYGYEWAAGGKKAETVSFRDVMSRAGRAGLSGIRSDASTYNPHFSYADEGVQHDVWFLDVATFINQMRLAAVHSLGGIAVSQLGYEDPAIWQVLHASRSSGEDGEVLSGLEILESESIATNVGRGAFLTMDDSRSDGFRRILPDESGNMVEDYERFPSYLTICHHGAAKEDQVAITFDDGPDPRWTPRILDVLKEKRVKAAFFVVGMKAESNPGIIRRMLHEGHEIGVHTYTHPNIAAVSRERAILELNATQRLIEVITGRSTILFRPPYNADSYPGESTTTIPIRLAQQLGYLTVAADIDPEDWERPGVEGIIDRVKRSRRAGGSIVLLHDAGGDRRQTVEALPRIVDYLLDRGDAVITLSDMLGESRDYLMPPVKEEGDGLTRLISGGGFRILHAFEELLWSFMIVGTVLVIIRSTIIAALARLHAGILHVPIDPYFCPPVSVIIAAYNEERVIGGTLRDLLGSRYPGKMEIIVVDDGSTDGTSRIVSNVMREDDRIHLLYQPNQGKARALQRGIRTAASDFLIMLDADTRFSHDTIHHLVQPFKDSHVAAVSGRAKVGNLRTFIARCQSLEYTCGFNLDRLAYDKLDCITVVPGAVSALRRSAVLDVGGISGDTLAEDTDLTLSLHSRGYRIAYTPGANAWTEAPETYSGLTRQRFRWAFGTLQCLWKHRGLLFKGQKPALGWFSLPNMWVFQIALVALGPIVDALVVWSLLFGIGQAIYAYFLASLAVDFFLAGLACRMEDDSLRNAWMIIPMRFIYRPLLSWVIWRSLMKAAKGAWVGWGKLDRTASVPGRSL